MADTTNSPPTGSPSTFDRLLETMRRLRDPETGRTSVYLKESERFNLPGMLGELIGIVGKKSYNGGLQITIIAPQRIEVLTPQE